MKNPPQIDPFSVAGRKFDNRKPDLCDEGTSKERTTDSLFANSDHTKKSVVAAHIRAVTSLVPSVTQRISSASFTVGLATGRHPPIFDTPPPRQLLRVVSPSCASVQALYEKHASHISATLYYSLSPTSPPASVSYAIAGKKGNGVRLLCKRTPAPLNQSMPSRLVLAEQCRRFRCSTREVLLLLDLLP